MTINAERNCRGRQDVQRLGEEASGRFVEEWYMRFQKGQSGGLASLNVSESNEVSDQVGVWAWQIQVGRKGAWHSRLER